MIINELLKISKEIIVKPRLKGGSYNQEEDIKISALNMRGAPNKLKHLDKAIIWRDIINSADMIMVLETGCTDKLPDIYNNQY